LSKIKRMKFQRSKYSRRIRKKKRVGEFRQYGFSVDVYCGPDPEGKIIDKVIDIVISKGMYCTGGGDQEKYQFFFDELKNESDKEWVSNEIKKIEEVKDVVYYGTIDVWHDDADQYFEEIDNLRKEYGEKKRPS
jgi:uncharacterized protein YggL (DUF469 family)